MLSLTFQVAVAGLPV